MADHEALVALAQVAFDSGSRYLNQADGWNVIRSEGGYTFSIMPTDVEHVAKLEGDLNKPPQFVVKFISGNWKRLREAHLRNHGETEYVKSFEDKSHVIKEVTILPGVGEITQYKYFSHRGYEDGSIAIVGTNAGLPEYPEGSTKLVFFLLKATPTDSGSHVTLVMQSQTQVQLDEATKTAIGVELNHFYVSVIGEIQAAAA